MDIDQIKKWEEKIYYCSLQSSMKTDLIQFLHQKNTETANQLRARLLSKLFHAENAIAISEAYRNEGKPDAWYHSVEDHLEPNLSIFTNEERSRIMTIISHAHISQEKNTAFQDSLYNYIFMIRNKEKSR